MAKKIALKLISIYQKTLSPDYGWFKVYYPNGYCKFQPSCSQYTYEAVDKFGVIKGCWLGAKRIARCNPWSKGGQDEVPN